MKNRSYILKEFSYIAISKNGKTDNSNSDSNLFLPETTFNQIKKYVLENKINDNGTEIFNFLMPDYNRKDGEILRAKNYVGLIETKNKTTIEILPKIYKINKDTEIKAIFLKMLKSLRDTTFKYIDKSHIQKGRMPLLEIFISMFLEELSLIIKRGLKKNYISKEENTYFLKGKLLFNKHIKENSLHKERFFVRYDEFMKDRPENRIIKTTLRYLAHKSKLNSNKKRIRDYFYYFDDVNESSNIDEDFTKCNTNRLMKDYSLILKWCKVFLGKESFSNFKGSSVAYALLFPMEKLFESYIGNLVKKYFSGKYYVSLQDTGEHLLIEEKKFALKPDIVLWSPDREETIILDTKWKLIDQSNSRKNYGISQSDLYQMYAYAEKYKANRVILIYPANENFTKPIETIKRYNRRIEISVIPVDLSKEREEEIISEIIASVK